jgi:hypothetical protein
MISMFRARGKSDGYAADESAIKTIEPPEQQRCPSSQTPDTKLSPAPSSQQRVTPSSILLTVTLTMLQDIAREMPGKRVDRPKSMPAIS